MTPSTRWLSLTTACLLAVACHGDATAPRPDASTAPSAANALALGEFFSCALNSEGQAYCWGVNDLGELGNQTNVEEGGPTAVVTSSRFVAIGAAYRSVCALDAKGLAQCWGSFPGGISFVGYSYGIQPLAIASTVKFTSLTVGARFACGLDSSGAAYCWGVNTQGQLGNGGTDSSATPVAVAGGIRFASISAGFWSTCGLTSGGTAYCWGDNLFGELGHGTNDAGSSVPMAVSGSIQFKTLDVGSLGACGVGIDGTGYCWGYNGNGQVGDGTTDNRAAPTRIGGGLSFTRVRSGRGNSFTQQTCGLTTGGALYCWGNDDHGQLGAVAPDSCPYTTTTLPCSLSPIAVTGLSNVAAFDVGTRHACAILTTGDMMCWGDNRSAELGDGTTTDHATPVTVVGGLRFP